MNTFSWEELLESPRAYNPPGVLKAYCDSHTCAKKTTNGCISNSIGVIKNVSRKESFCLDCGSALYWSKSSYNPKAKKRYHLSESGEKNIRDRKT